MAAHYVLEVPGGGESVVKLRLTSGASMCKPDVDPFGPEFDEVFSDRKLEADDFYDRIIPESVGPHQRVISRQAYAGRWVWQQQLVGLQAEPRQMGREFIAPPSSPPPPSTLPPPPTGLLWTKQFYHYIVESWLEGDPEMPPPPSERKYGRNAQDWKHLFNRDIISMPDKWEYPWVRVGVSLGESGSIPG